MAMLVAQRIWRENLLCCFQESRGLNNETVDLGRISKATLIPEAEECLTGFPFSSNEVI
jgi:hypothetical protein